MKILLVYPEYPATFWSFRYALTFVDKKASLPPLGLLTVSSMLPANWEKKLVDMNVEKLDDETIKWADMVFMSGMIVQKKSAQEVIDRAKALGKTVVAGGPLFTTGHSAFHGVDHFVLNEGEVTIPLFLQDLKDGCAKHMYTSQERPDISSTPAPDWSLLKAEKYASLAVQISRGCPFKCEFCDVIVMNGRVPRLKTAQQVIYEFNEIYKSGWRGSVFIVDDNFIGNRAKVKVILREISKWMKAKKQPFTLYTEASINLADDPELMKLMQEANFNAVFVGIETPEPESLKSCGKVQNVGKDLAEKVQVLQANGLQVQAGFILGFDTDTPKTFDNMIKFIQKSGIVTSMVGLLTALPDTQLHKRLNDSGRLLKSATGDNTDFSLNFVPAMDKQTLIDGYKKVLESIFGAKNYNRRIITFLKNYKQHAKETKLSFVLMMRALFRTLWTIGFVEKGRKYFWQMFFWTFFTKPQYLGEAVTLAIYGYHYRTVLANNSGNT